MTKYTESNLYVYRVTSSQIKQKTLYHDKYSKLKSLNIDDNKSICNLDFLADTLEELHCARSCINQKVIDKLKYLKKLHGNAYINNVSHMRDYIKDISNCNINQENLNNLHKIKRLSINYNPHITDLSHLKNTLVDLECCGLDSGIGQDALNKLENLCVLKCIGNTKIKNVNKWKNSLKKLYCASSGIDQEGISDLTILEVFSTDSTISKKRTIYMYNVCHDVTHIAKNLREIECKYIDQDTLNETLNLEKLITNPFYIKNLDHLKGTLTHLDFGCFPINKNIIDRIGKLKFLQCTMV